MPGGHSGRVPPAARGERVRSALQGPPDLTADITSPPEQTSLPGYAPATFDGIRSADPAATAHPVTDTPLLGTPGTPPPPRLHPAKPSSNKRDSSYFYNVLDSLKKPINIHSPPRTATGDRAGRHRACRCTGNTARFPGMTASRMPAKPAVRTVGPEAGPGVRALDEGVHTDSEGQNRHGITGKTPVNCPAGQPLAAPRSALGPSCSASRPASRRKRVREAATEVENRRARRISDGYQVVEVAAARASRRRRSRRGLLEHVPRPSPIQSADCPGGHRPSQEHIPGTHIPGTHIPGTAERSGKLSAPAGTVIVSLERPR